jgi:hypothetical protein
MKIFCIIIATIILYIFLGVGTYFVVCWYDKKYEHIEYTDDALDAEDSLMILLWPFVFLALLFNLCVKGIVKIIIPLRQYLYKRMDEKHGHL